MSDVLRIPFFLVMILLISCGKNSKEIPCVTFVDCPDGWSCIEDVCVFPGNGSVDSAQPDDTGAVDTGAGDAFLPEGEGAPFSEESVVEAEPATVADSDQPISEEEGQAEDVSIPDAEGPDGESSDEDTCLSDCAIAGTRECPSPDGPNYRECIDHDGCLLWEETPCGAQSICQGAGMCIACGDPAVIPLFAGGSFNPVLLPVVADADQGSDNIYAPDVHKINNSLYLMYYGAQNGAGHDQIFLASSTDGHHWHHYPSLSAPDPVIANGSSNHVNDPSLVIVNGSYYLYYTDAATGEDDRIHLATSSDGFSWAKQGLVLDIGAVGSWDSQKVGRPSASYVGSTFYLYYDGNDGTARHVGLATSSDGIHFTKSVENPLVLNQGAIDVKLVGSTVVMVSEGQEALYGFTSADGVHFCPQGEIAEPSGSAFDAYGMVTPFLFVPDGGTISALFYGGASVSTWNKNRIAELYPSGFVRPADPWNGCDSCLSSSGNPNCTVACRTSFTTMIEGLCGNPGSSDPNACCACVEKP